MSHTIITGTSVSEEMQLEVMLLTDTDSLPRNLY
jgi:hypothetical protein